MYLADISGNRKRIPPRTRYVPFTDSSVVPKTVPPSMIYGNDVMLGDLGKFRLKKVVKKVGKVVKKVAKPLAIGAALYYGGGALLKSAGSFTTGASNIFPSVVNTAAQLALQNQQIKAQESAIATQSTPSYATQQNSSSGGNTESSDDSNRPFTRSSSTPFWLLPALAAGAALLIATR